MSSLPPVGTTGVTPLGTSRSAWPHGATPDRERLSVGYVFAGVFFLLVAAIGFGLWLALEVVAL